MLLFVALPLALSGCGGEGGGGGDDAAEEHPAERDQRFADEAVARVLDRAHVSCELVVCEGDADVEEVVESPLGLVSTGCQYTCLPVEIDGSDTRFYWVIIAWRRAVDACYRRERFDVLLLAEVTVPCVPTQ
jgi:hypothetical protein